MKRSNWYLVQGDIAVRKPVRWFFKNQPTDWYGFSVPKTDNALRCLDKLLKKFNHKVVAYEKHYLVLFPPELGFWTVQRHVFSPYRQCIKQVIGGENNDEA